MYEASLKERCWVQLTELGVINKSTTTLSEMECESYRGTQVVSNFIILLDFFLVYLVVFEMLDKFDTFVHLGNISSVIFGYIFCN